MTPTDRVQLFDDWAEHYDTAIALAENDFPFAGYDRVLDQVVALANVTPHMRILDLGIGTGNLAERFVREGCAVWGIDFSAEMLARVRAKLLPVNLVQADLLGDWPLKFSSPFNRVVSAYVLHEFALETKVELLERVARRCLAIGGRMVIADIAFPTAAARSVAAQRWANAWDQDEYYWAADETIAACERAGLHVAYKQISSCAGVFAFTIS